MQNTSDYCSCISNYWKFLQSDCVPLRSSVAYQTPKFPCNFHTAFLMISMYVPGRSQDTVAHRPYIPRHARGPWTTVTGAMAAPSPEYRASSWPPFNKLKRGAAPPPALPGAKTVTMGEPLFGRGAAIGSKQTNTPTAGDSAPEHLPSMMAVRRSRGLQGRSPHPQPVVDRCSGLHR
jgi:hypothetical protein